MQYIDLAECIGPAFYDSHRAVINGNVSEIDEMGGRGSLKSSFVSIEIVYGMMRDRQLGEITHAVCLRQTANTLKESVFEQIGWAIEKLSVRHLWKRSLTPMKWIYMPNSKKPQEIRFRGCDDPGKVKSIKFAYGYAKYLWFEEKDQFKSAKDCKNIRLSLARKNGEKDSKFITFSTFNPPELPNHWINIDAKLKKPNRRQNHTDYTQVPKGWITDEFLEEAEFTKQTDIDEYNHVFLGKVTGIKGLAYPQFDINSHVVDINDFKFGKFERIAKVICGCDGGVIIDNTTLVPLLLTTAGRIISLPTFCFDPQNLNHKPLASNYQVKLMEMWLDFWLKWLMTKHHQSVTVDDVMIVVDSAAQDLVLSFNDITKYKAIPTPGKDRKLDWKRHQNVLSVPGYFLLLNAGYIDPTNMKFVGDYDKYIEEITALLVDEKTGLPIDAGNHTIDAINYAIKIATQIM